MRIKDKSYKEIESLEELKSWFFKKNELNHVVFQNLDLSSFSDELFNKVFSSCVFLGCNIPEKNMMNLIEKGNLIFPELTAPYNPFRSSLYKADELYTGFDITNPDSYKNTPDHLIYKHYLETGKYNPASIYESLCRRLHDHAITDALTDRLESIDQKKLVAIMGGHSLSRIDEDYKKAALISKHLSEKGYLMLSGGGPGAMEATHLGAWLADRPDEDLDRAIDVLKPAPLYNDEMWLSTAFEVMKKFLPVKKERIDIGIPTWLYGHEPATPFAANIAKYFANSVREEGLLALAFGGIVYCPGSAGTIQEIFQDATQNHYGSYGIISPMVFLNKKFWNETKPVFPLLEKLSKGKEYHDLLYISDDIKKIESFIVDFSS